MASSSENNYKCFIYVLVIEKAIAYNASKNKRLCKSYGGETKFFY